jgi:hypothetical protein
MAVAPGGRPSCGDMPMRCETVVKAENMRASAVYNARGIRVRRLPIRIERFARSYPATPSVPMVPIEKSNHVPSKSYALNPAAVRVFGYGLACSGKRLSFETGGSAQQKNTRLSNSFGVTGKIRRISDLVHCCAQDSNPSVRIGKAGLWDKNQTCSRVNQMLLARTSPRN